MKRQIKSKKSKKGVSLRNLPLGSVDFKEQIRDFEQWLRVFGFAKTTIYYSPTYVKSFFYYLENSGILEINKVSNIHVKRFIEKLTYTISKHTGRILSQNYTLNHLTALKIFSRYLLESKGTTIDFNLKFSRGLSNTRKWLIIKDIEGLYEACSQGSSGHINRAILAIYYGLGLRRMEGIGLDISDIQWNSGLVYVKHAKFNKERYVPMNQRVLKDLEIYNVKYRKPILEILGKKYEEALLISEQGERITGNAVYARLQNLARKSGVKIPLSLHTLRHSIATHLLDNGLAMENISQFLGHKSLESTQIYTHLIHENK